MLAVIVFWALGVLLVYIKRLEAARGEDSKRARKPPRWAGITWDRRALRYASHATQAGMLLAALTALLPETPPPPPPPSWVSDADFSWMDAEAAAAGAYIAGHPMPACVDGQLSAAPDDPDWAEAAGTPLWTRPPPCEVTMPHNVVGCERGRAGARDALVRHADAVIACTHGSMHADAACAAAASPPAGLGDGYHVPRPYFWALNATRPLRPGQLTRTLVVAHEAARSAVIAACVSTSDEQ